MCSFISKESLERFSQKEELRKKTIIGWDSKPWSEKVIIRDNDSVNENLAVGKKWHESSMASTTLEKKSVRNI